MVGCKLLSVCVHERHSAAEDQTRQAAVDRLCSLLFLDFGPVVLEGDRSVEDQLFGSRFFIDTEIADPLELASVARLGSG